MTTNLQRENTVNIPTAQCCENCRAWSMNSLSYVYPCHDIDCICHNPPTDTTVEKWEKLGSLGLSETQKKAISYMHYRAVQEAKVERDREWRKRIEAMIITNNVTIPVCRKCDFFGTNEDYCPKCGDNLTPETSTGYIERVKNSLLSDLLTKEEYDH